MKTDKDEQRIVYYFTRCDLKNKYMYVIHKRIPYHSLNILKRIILINWYNESSTINIFI